MPLQFMDINTLGKISLVRNTHFLCSHNPFIKGYPVIPELFGQIENKAFATDGDIESWASTTSAKAPWIAIKTESLHDLRKLHVILFPHSEAMGSLMEIRLTDNIEHVFRNRMYTQGNLLETVNITKGWNEDWTIISFDYDVRNKYITIQNNLVDMGLKRGFNIREIKMEYYY